MHLRNEQGISLVELLATIVIASFIMVLLFSITTQSTHTYKQQSEQNQTLNDASYAFKVLTKEIRKNPENIVLPDILPAKEININNITYEFSESEHVLTRDNKPFIRNVQSFFIQSNNGEIQIEMIHEDGNTFTTTLFIR